MLPGWAIPPGFVSFFNPGSRRIFVMRLREKLVKLISDWIGLYRKSGRDSYTSGLLSPLQSKSIFQLPIEGKLSFVNKAKARRMISGTLRPCRQAEEVRNTDYG